MATTTARAAPSPHPYRVAAWANWMRLRTAVVIDTETTDFAGSICEIAVVDLGGHTLLDTLVRPGERITSIATAVHGITNADVDAAPPLIDVVDELLAVTRGRPVLAYNAPFDYGVLTHDAQQQGIDIGRLASWRRWGCVMRAQAAATGQPWQRLEAGHRACGDAHAAATIVRQLARASAEKPSGPALKRQP